MLSESSEGARDILRFVAANLRSKQTAQKYRDLALKAHTVTVREGDKALQERLEELKRVKAQKEDKLKLIKKQVCEKSRLLKLHAPTSDCSDDNVEILAERRLHYVESIRKRHDREYARPVKSLIESLHAKAVSDQDDNLDPRTTDQKIASLIKLVPQLVQDIKTLNPEGAS